MPFDPGGEPWEGFEARHPDPEALGREFAARGCSISARALPPDWVGVLFVEPDCTGIRIQLSPDEVDGHAETLSLMQAALSDPARKRWHRLEPGGPWIYFTRWSGTPVIPATTPGVRAGWPPLGGGTNTGP